MTPGKEETVDFGYQQVPRADKAQRVRAVFDSVASRYDLMNDLMSGGTHRLWKKFALSLTGLKLGGRVLDVAGGTGDLAAGLAQQVGQSGLVVLTDINAAMLNAGRDRLIDAGLVGNVLYTQADAERLPFPDAAFDHAFTVTVLEECDADQALRELFRVVKPGGRVGVIVRAIDMPQWWHLALPDPIRRKANVPPQSNGPRGVADASLYRRMRAAGFRDLTCFPALVTFDRPDGPIWRYREDHVLGQLNEAETAIWRAATQAARADGLLFMANPLHRAVGIKPAA